jgi:hypothetical protein
MHDMLGANDTFDICLGGLAVSLEFLSEVYATLPEHGCGKRNFMATWKGPSLIKAYEKQKMTPQVMDCIRSVFARYVL